MGFDATVAAGTEVAASGVAEDPPAAARVQGLTDALGATDEEVGLDPENVSLLEKLFLRRLQRGDPRAFRELVRKHQDRVFSMTLRMLGDAHEAEDVSQEVFVAVHKNLARFRGDSRLSTWIYRVTKNHCLNRLKYLEKRESGGDADLARIDASQIDDVLLARPERPDQAILGAEERVAVQRALQRLSAEHRLLVVLRDIEGLAYEDIARVAELPAGTVKSRLHRARAALAEVLAAAGMAPEGAAPRERA